MDTVYFGVVAFKLFTPKTQYTTTEEITIDIFSKLPDSKAWIGLYKADQVGSMYWDWTEGKTSGRMNIPHSYVKNLNPGKYFIHLFKDEKYEVIATTKIMIVV